MGWGGVGWGGVKRVRVASFIAALSMSTSSLLQRQQIVTTKEVVKG